METVKKMARTKVQLDTSLEVENQQGITSYVNNNDGGSAQPVLVIHCAYIYRYIDSEFLTRRLNFSTFSACLLASACNFLRLFHSRYLTRNVFDALASAVKND